MSRRITPSYLLVLLSFCAALAGCDGPSRPSDGLFVTSMLTPNSGTMLGGTQVVLTGHGFREGVTVFFGAVPAVVKEVSNLKLTVETPAHAAGAVNVVVTNPGGVKHPLIGAYTFDLDPPFIVSGVITEVTADGVRPVEDVEVFEYGNRSFVLTDTSGAYRLPVRRSYVELQITKSGYETDWREIKSTSDIRLDVQLSRISK